MCGVLTLESTVLEYDGPGYSVAKKLVETYEEDKKKGTNLLDSHSAKAAILQNRLSLLVRKTDQVEPDSYVVNLQGSKRDRDSEEEDDTEDQTITGGKNVSWIVDSIGIRIRVTLCKSHIELMEDTNLLLESISEGTYIIGRISRRSNEDCKMLKTLMNRLAELRPNSDIRKIKLYAMQLYLP
ncbi:unnamed protein product [Rhizophagus irregularis]|nr:unnamed protein product [Rhizophagus irregularis]